MDAHFYRHALAPLTAALLRRFGARALERVEDAIQVAMERSISAWVRGGVPDNPTGWLYRVAVNHVLEQHRRQRTAERHHETLPEPEVEPDTPLLAGEIPDDLLRMLFACADPELPGQASTALALRFLCGFSTEEIAARLFLTVANVQKTLTRGRARLRERWSEAWTHGDPERLPAVQRVIYLLFTEGHQSTRSEAPIRAELCHEALRLARILAAHPAGAAGSTWALVALLGFHVARLPARTSTDGHPVLLMDQDRQRWDPVELAQAYRALMRSTEAGEPLTRYHCEAAVLAEYCAAPTYAATRWDEIVRLYDLVQRIAPSPVNTVNQAIALAEWQGPAAGLARLREMSPPGWLTSWYLWDATLGELSRRAGRFDEAVHYLARSAEGAPTDHERALLEKRRHRALAGDSDR